MISKEASIRMRSFATGLLALLTALPAWAAPAGCPEAGRIDIWRPVGGKLSLPADRGRLLACMHVASVSAAALSASPLLAARGRRADHGYEQFVIQYVSQGPPDRLRRVTALLYLPSGGAGPHPIVAVNHGTAGIGPACGPSHRSIDTDYMALPLVAQGHAVVAADYLGMGVDDGVSPYLAGESAAYTILDGVRAIKQLRDRRFPVTRLGDGLFLLGHSQGGQATLFAHQLYDASVGVKLLGSIAIAPGWGDVRGLDLVFKDPARPTDLLTLILVMGLYGDMVYRGAPAASTWLTADAQARLPALLHDQCIEQLVKSVPAAWPTQGDLFTPGFLAAASSCPFRGEPCPAFQPWARDLAAGVPGAFHSDVPVLLVEGARDEVVPPYTVACIESRLRRKGTPVAACSYPGSTHYTIVADAMDDVLAWMAARRRGETANVCRAPLTARCP